MNFLSLRSSPNPLNSTISCLQKSTRILKPRNAIPARDRVIDFGKYKGKMLGTIPSNYLKWVSNNLRARDFEEWAKLADEVLDDPVYRDRIEWESAQKVLNGDVLSSTVMIQQNSAVSDLAEISESFGWDNEDKVGWSKVDFGLLGTSKGGRIPRLSLNGEPRPNKDVGLEIVGSNLSENGPVDGSRRRDRRERLKLRRKKNNGVENGEVLGINANDDNVGFGSSSDINLEGSLFDDDQNVGEIKKSAFPGREAFLKKVLNRTRKC